VQVESKNKHWNSTAEQKLPKYNWKGGRKLRIHPPLKLLTFLMVTSVTEQTRASAELYLQ